MGTLNWIANTELRWELATRYPTTISFVTSLVPGKYLFWYRIEIFADKYIII